MRSRCERRRSRRIDRLRQPRQRLARPARRRNARSRPSVAASAPPNVTSSMRPEWLISITASGRASAGQGRQWLATCCATNDVKRDAGDRHLAAEAAAAQAVSSAVSSAWPAMRSSEPVGAEREERLAAIEARHGAQAVIGANRLDHPPAHRGQLPAEIVRRRQQVESRDRARCRRSASRRAGRRLDDAGIHRLAAGPRAQPRRRRRCAQPVFAPAIPHRTAAIPRPIPASSDAP